MKKIKICGLFRDEDIRAVNKYKPDYAGFIINFPKSHRNLSPEAVEALTKQLSSDIKAVGVTVDQPLELVADLINRNIFQVTQLHGKEDREYIQKLRSLIPKDTPIWQAIQVKSQTDVEKANESPADFIILDAGQGSGTTFDWSILDGINREFGLAGGINIENVHEALKTRATLLDISGGVETDKLKDSYKIDKIINVVRNMNYWADCGSAKHETIYDSTFDA